MYDKKFYAEYHESKEELLESLFQPDEFPTCHFNPDRPMPCQWLKFYRVYSPEYGEEWDEDCGLPNDKICPLDIPEEVLEDEL